MNYNVIVSLILLFSFAYINSADAYIDPNTGGFFFTTVAPFVYGLLGVVVVFWKRIIGFFKGLFGRNNKQDSSSEDS